MQQAGLSGTPRGSKAKSQRIFRAGNITNSIVIVGDNNHLSLNSEGNAILNPLPKSQRPIIRRITAPVLVGRPQHTINLLDRDTERATVQNALQAGSSVEFYGPEGFGKTTLLRALASQFQLKDGMVLIDNGKSLDDVLQELFEAFFRSSQGYKLTQVEYRRRFETIQALILVDNYKLSREETQILTGSLPNCVLVFASNERHLWNEGNAIHLSGLPSNIALSLFQLHVGRQLNKKEINIAQSICDALLGHPLNIIQAAAQVHDAEKSLTELARQTPGVSPREWILQGSLANLPRGANSLLALLATLRGAPLLADHITGILKTTQLGPLLKNLLNRGLVKAHSPRYTLAGDLGKYLSRIWNLAEWNETSLRYFLNWTSIPLSDQQILDSAEALIATMENASAGNRWREVIQIGVAIEPGFVTGRRWGGWEQLLKLVLRAGQNVGDRAIEGWCFHQLGSRALALGIMAEAGQYLSQALEIRRSIGDRSGVSATQHNLSQMGGGMPPRTPPRSNGGLSSFKGWMIPVIGVAIVTILITLDIFGHKESTTTPSDTATFTQIETSAPALTTSAPTVTDTFTATSSLSPTENPSFTPTRTVTPSRTATSSVTPSITPSRTATYTFTPTKPSPTPIPLLTFKIELRPEKTILYQGQDRGNAYFEVPTNIIINNPSPQKFDGLNLSLRFDAFDGSHPASFRLWGENDYRNNMSISVEPMGETGFGGVYVLVPKSYSGRTIRLIAESNQCNTYFNCTMSKTKYDIPRVIYDFIANAANAQWFGYDPARWDPDGTREVFYSLVFDQSGGDKGSANLITNPMLENGSQPLFALGTHPTWVPNGKIEGWYSSPSVQAGDRIIAKVGFGSGAGGDGVTFKIRCTVSMLQPQTNLISPNSITLVSYNKKPSVSGEAVIFSLYDSNDGVVKEIDVSLPTAAVNICNQYILEVDAGPTSSQDWAVWLAAYIVRP